MEDYQKRVCEEEIELSKKIDKLQVFIDNLPCSCSRHEHFLLLVQVWAMFQYRDILLERIESFK